MIIQLNKSQLQESNYRITRIKLQRIIESQNYRIKLQNYKNQIIELQSQQNHRVIESNHRVYRIKLQNQIQKSNHRVNRVIESITRIKLQNHRIIESNCRLDLLKLQIRPFTRVKLQIQIVDYGHKGHIILTTYEWNFLKLFIDC